MTYQTTILVLTCALGFAGCSNQWRDDGLEISSEEMLTMLDEVKGAQSASVNGNSLNEALSLRDDPSVVIYFADARDSGRSAVSVASLVSYGFLGEPNLGWDQVADVRVFYLNTVSTSGSRDGLIVGLKKVGATAFTYYGLTGYSEFNDDMFESVLSMNGQERLVLRSFDVEDGDLAPVIQLKAFEVGSNGSETYIGKFTSLVGFGG